MKDNATLIIAVIAGTIFSGSLAWLFLTDQGKKLLREKASDAISKKTRKPNNLVKKE
jgi:hypothetical protein